MMKKILKIVCGMIGEIIELAGAALAFAMIFFLFGTFLLSSRTGTISEIVKCDRTCYEALAMQNAVPYRDNLEIIVKRRVLECEYVTLSGIKRDFIWLSNWTYDTAFSGDKDIVIENSRAWPLLDNHYDIGNVPIRYPRSDDEIGCPARHPDFDSIGQKENRIAAS